MPEIVPAERIDGPALLALTARINIFLPEEVACVEELWDAYLAQGTASGYHFIAYRDAGDVLGFACYGPAALTHGTYHLYWIAVEPARHGQGIGGAILSRVERDVAGLEARLLVVETSGKADYAATRRFYEGCGYERAAGIRDFYDAGDDLVIYTRRFR